MKKKVALVLHSIDIIFSPDGGVKGGANRVNLFLLQALVAEPDIELTLISLAGQVKTVAGVDHHFFFDKSIYTEKAYVLAKISAFLTENPHDAVLFSDVIAPFGSTLFHSHSFAHRQAIKPWWVKPFTALATRKRHALQKQQIGDVRNRKFFTVSQAVKTDWAIHFGMDANLISVAYPGVVMPVESETAVKPQKEENSPLVFGMVNTSSLKKGGLLFILALGLLKLSGYSFSVKMIHPKITKDPLTTVFIFLLGLKSTVTILPFQADTNAFYGAIDVFVMPSLHEAFGLVITEAMSHGVVPISSANAGVAELMAVGKTGFTFNVEHLPVWHLYCELKKILDLPSQTLQLLKNTAKSSATNFTWQQFSQTIIEQLKC